MMSRLMMDYDKEYTKNTEPIRDSDYPTLYYDTVVKGSDGSVINFLRDGTICIEQGKNKITIIRETISWILRVEEGLRDIDAQSEKYLRDKKNAQLNALDIRRQRILNDE